MNPVTQWRVVAQPPQADPKRSTTADRQRKRADFRANSPFFPRGFSPLFSALLGRLDPGTYFARHRARANASSFKKFFGSGPLEHTVHHPSETTQPACGVTALWSILVSGFRSGSSERTCQEMPHRLPRSRASCGTRFRNVVVHEAASFAAGLLGFFPLPYRHRSLPPMFGFGPHFTVSRNRADSG